MRTNADDVLTADQAALNNAVEVFFAAFTSGPECTKRIQALRELFLPRAVITRTCGREAVSYDVEEFLAPRQRMLIDGTLIDFHEWPLHGHLDIFGDIAHWFGAYAKAGTHAGKSADGRGMKSIQFIRTATGWRINAVAWDDERVGLTIRSTR